MFSANILKLSFFTVLSVHTFSFVSVISAPRTRLYTPIAVTDPPVLIVRPQKRLYSVGEILTIIAWSRPAAQRYVWLDRATGETRNGAQLVITSDMVGVNNLTCFAINRIFGVEYNGSIQFDFEVFESTYAPE